MSKQDSPWEILRKEEGINIKLFDIEFEFVKLKRTGHETKVVRLNSADSCNVVAITKDKNIVMTKQFRFGINEYTLEIPGGFVDEGEDPSDAVKRELEEETGYVSEHWVYLGKMPSNPVFQNSYIHHFAAYDVQPNGKLNWDDSEDIELILRPLQNIKDALKKGEFQHPHTVSAFSLIDL